MNRAEKAFMIFYWCYILIYGCCFVYLGVTDKLRDLFHVVMPFHFFGMAIGIPMLIILFRDLYKREFPNPNSKITWTILILMFCPSILVYLYWYGFRTR